MGKRRKERVKQKETLVGRDGRRAGRSASRANIPSASTYSCVQWTPATAEPAFAKLLNAIAKTSTEVISVDLLCKVRAATIRLFKPVAHSKLTSSSWTTFTSCTLRPPRFILLQKFFSFILTSTRGLRAARCRRLSVHLYAKDALGK